MQAEAIAQENGLLVDTAGRPITPVRLRRALNVNIACGIMGAAWFTVCAPQQILTVFYKNSDLLGASAGELGLMVALVQLSAIFHLAAIFIYSRTRTRKFFWVTAHILHRLLGFVLAGVAVYAAQEGADKSLGAKIIAAAMVISWVLTTSAASAWWSWMADLVPENIRATFFGRRATIVRAVNIVWFFGITFALDHLKIINIFYVYAAVFALAGLLGVLDIVIHTFIPEPARGADVEKVGWKEFTEPLRNRNFFGFSLAIGAWSFSTSILGPFVAPYITDPDGIGAPMTWLSINMAVAQLTMIATGTAWGIVMDRFGRKPAVFLGALHPIFTWAGLFFMTPGNYPFILVSTAFVAGLLAAGFWDGSAQLMLTLTPQRNRNAYLSWHMATVSIIAAGGSYLGGFLGDALATFHYELWSGFVMGEFHVVAAVSFVLSTLSVLMLLKIREGSEKPVGYVVSRLFTPGIFRTFMSMGTITSAATSTETARALRSLNGASGHLAVADILGRLRDPAPEVREEAARALGRIGSTDAIDALIERLRDPNSTIRPEVAQALGQIGDPRAVPALVEALSCPLPEVQDACARALESIKKPGGRRTARRLRSVEDASDGLTVETIIARLDDPDAEIREEAARALGRIGAAEAVEALAARLRDETSTIRSDAAWALGRIGDLRAIPALTKSLNSGSVELQDACARALGDIGGREAIRHLLRLLEEKHHERVIASSAEAVSKLGILEAAWEIVPRMHETANPVLRGQLAIAMGNLLGRPGEFYAHLTGETKHPGKRLPRLMRGVRYAITSFKPAAADAAERAVLGQLQGDLARIRGLMEAQAYRDAIEGLHAILRVLVRMAIDRQCDDDMALEYALARDARLGLGFWFMQHVRRRMEKITDLSLLHTDALLALYFLSAYRLPRERHI